MQDWKNAWQAADDLLKIKSSLKDYAVVKDEDEVISRTNPEILFSQGSLNVQNAFTGNGGDFCIANG